MPSGDPTCTANVYCNRRIDELLLHAIAPWWQALRAREPGAALRLWLIRYSRRGEHLKLRVHCPAGLRAVGEESLDEAVSAFMASLPPAGDDVRISRPDAPAIDAEDDGPSNHPDRTLRWTTYRRSPVSLGPQTLLDSDRYAELMTSCLAHGTELVLAGLLRSGGVGASRTQRQRILLKVLVAALASRAFTNERRAAYLEYHRNWLLRFVAPDEDAEAGTLAQFDREVARSATASVQLERLAAARWHQAGASPGTESATASWADSVDELTAYLARFRGRDDAAVDMFTSDPVSPPLFKATHGVANMLALSFTEEAFTHHLLLRSCTRHRGTTELIPTISRFGPELVHGG